MTMNGKKVSLLVNGQSLTGIVVNEPENQQCIIIKEVTYFVKKDEPEKGRFNLLMQHSWLLMGSTN